MAHTHEYNILLNQIFAVSLRIQRCSVADDDDDDDDDDDET